MRGKKRTKEEKYELFQPLEEYLGMGFSLKKACDLADLSYSTMRDIINCCEPLRVKVALLRNRISIRARENIIESIKGGDIKNSKWWIDRFDNLESDESKGLGVVEPVKWVVIDESDVKNT